MKFKIFKYDVVSSTNDVAIDLIKKKKYEKGFVYALSQKKGRGRQGKKWISLKGNIFLSIFYKINKKKSLKKITKFNRDIIKKILSNLFEIKISIKLPNDLLIN